MKFHPVSNIFPMMSQEEYEALRDDIETNGLIDPIWVYDNKIIDGRNRFLACEELGIKPRFRYWPANGSLVGFVVSLNLKRRHLNPGQKAIAALTALPHMHSERQQGGDRRSLDYQSGNIATPKGRARDEAAITFGTSPRYVQDAKKLQQVNEALFEQVRDGEQTLSQAMRKVRREEVLQKIEAKNIPLDDSLGTFSVILADPPWQYDFSPSISRAIELHYPTMPSEDIKALPVQDICADDALLFLWCPPAFTKKGIAVMEAWGFSYRTNMVWVKPSIGAGQWVRQQHELLLIGRRGNFPTPEQEYRTSSLIKANRSKHSEKPPVVYGLIETMYPDMRRIELFARRERKGWHSWGNEVSPQTNDGKKKEPEK